MTERRQTRDISDLEAKLHSETARADGLAKRCGHLESLLQHRDGNHEIALQNALARADKAEAELLELRRSRCSHELTSPVVQLDQVVEWSCRCGDRRWRRGEPDAPDFVAQLLRERDEANRLVGADVDFQMTHLVDCDPNTLTEGGKKRRAQLLAWSRVMPSHVTDTIAGHEDASNDARGRR